MMQLKKKENLYLKKDTSLYIIIIIHLIFILFCSCTENKKEFSNTNFKNNGNKILLYDKMVL